MGANFFSEPLFWAFVLAMAAGIVCVYFVIRQALVDAHFEIKRREQEQTERGGLKR